MPKPFHSVGHLAARNPTSPPSPRPPHLSLTHHACRRFSTNRLVPPILPPTNPSSRRIAMLEQLRTCGYVEEDAVPALGATGWRLTRHGIAQLGCAQQLVTQRPALAPRAGVRLEDATAYELLARLQAGGAHTPSSLRLAAHPPIHPSIMPSL